MARLLAALFVAIVVFSWRQTSAQQASSIASETASACRPPMDDDLGLSPPERTSWSPCEKWIWSCLRKGQEANLFKRACATSRSKLASDWRDETQFIPFISPDRQVSNAVRSQFVVDLLSKEPYSGEISVFGVRIVGAYFVDELVLENLRTDRNLVLDNSIFKSGIRLTNYRSSKNVSLDGSNVRGVMRLNRFNIDGSLFMSKGVYDQVDLREARIGSSFEAPSSIFTGRLFLDRARIDGKVSLVRALLTEVTGRGTVASSFWLGEADIRGRLDLSGAQFNGDLRLQTVRFGRGHSDGPVACDWDIGSSKVFLGPVMKQSHLADDLRREVVEDRPSVNRTAAGTMCVRGPDGKTSPIPHEVLLRDMAIKGTLCIVDITGSRNQAGSRKQDAADVMSVSLNGTEARSTVIRWVANDDPDARSETLWSIVLFKTAHLLLDLGGSPKNFFIDNIELGTISFMNTRKPGGQAARDENEDEDIGSGLCSARPDPISQEDAASRRIHERIRDFLAKNKADSIQPFAKLVERLDEVGASSTYLQLQLNSYRYEKICATSHFFREHRRARLELPSVPSPESRTALEWVVEWKDRALDTGCLVTSFAYMNTIGYGLAFVPTQLLFFLGFGGLVVYSFRSYRKTILLAAERRIAADGTDIFISYAKDDRALAERMARKLRQKGYSVWWDTSILSGENYRDIILRELAGAKAVIVIWTQHSVNSEWVISEGQRAMAQNKLLPVRDGRLDTSAIPPPFDVRHTVLITDEDALLLALDQRKISRSLIPASI